MLTNSFKRIALFASLGLAAVIALPQPQANARSRTQRAEQADATFYERNAAPRCQAWCSNDFSPCDPANFKVSDGRCAGINTGSVGVH